MNLHRILPRIGDRTVDTLRAADVAALIAELHADGLRRESIRKTISTLSQVLAYAKVEPNPAKDESIRLPREDKAEINPPTAEHVLAAYRLLAPDYRLPVLVLDQTGMRVGELEALTWGDVDEPRGRWRVTAAVSKNGHARWVYIDEVLFGAVTALVPREDRNLDHQVFADFSADADGHRACMQGGWRAVVESARPAPSSYLARAPAG